MMLSGNHGAQCRLIAGIVIWVWVFGESQQLTLMAVQCLLLLLGLLLCGIGWQVLRGMFKVLLWLALPILLLHALLTPGELWLSSWPMTYEGLRQGGQLALHLTNLFLAGLLLVRLLSPAEWLRQLSWLPESIRRRVWVDWCWLQRVQQPVRIALAELRNQWREMHYSPMQLPALLADAIGRMMQLSRESVWSEQAMNDWPTAGTLWWPWLMIAGVVVWWIAR